MNGIRALVAAAPAVTSAISPACAMSKQDFMTLVMPMSDVETNQRLEKEFSSLVETNDAAGIAALGDRVRSENGKALDELAAMARRLEAAGETQSFAESALRAKEGKGPPNPDVDLMLTLGPCQYAGMLLRNIVTGIAKGEAKPVFRHGTVMIDDYDQDAMFAEMMDRCEIIKNKRSPARLIGTRCSSTGQGCMEDPDEAEEAESPK